MRRYPEPESCVAADVKPCDVGPVYWHAELDRQLRTLVASGTTLEVIAFELEISVDEIRKQLRETALDA